MPETVAEIVYRIAWERTMSEEDNWIHRAENMRCRTCMFYVPKVSGAAVTIAPGQPIEVSAPAIGRCRRHAPTMNGFPVMFPTDWCGDHELNENAL